MMATDFHFRRKAGAMPGPISVALAAVVFATMQPVAVMAQTTATTTSSQTDPETAARAAAQQSLSSALMILTRNPSDPDALRQAGEAALQLQDPRAAMGFLNRAETLRPRDGRIKAAMGAAFALLDEGTMAIRYFDAASGLGSVPAQYIADRGLAYDLVGDNVKAQRDYVVAAQLAPSAEVVRRHAISLGIAGQMDKAIDMLGPLLRQQDRAAWRTRAMVLAMNGRAGEAGQVANATMPREMASALTPYFAVMDRLTAVQLASAAHFGRFPPLDLAQTQPRRAGIQLAQATVPTAPPRKETRRQREARLEQERIATERAALAKAAQERADRERLARENAERTRLAQQAEQQRLAAEQAAQAKAETERLAAAERAAAEATAAARLAAERAAAESAAKVETERLAAAKAEQERAAEAARIASVAVPTGPTTMPVVQGPPAEPAASRPVSTPTSAPIAVPSEVAATTTPVVTPGASPTESWSLASVVQEVGATDAPAAAPNSGLSIEEIDRIAAERRAAAARERARQREQERIAAREKAAADAKTAAAEKAKQEAEAKAKAEAEARRANPPRVWAQVASGSNVAALRNDFRRMAQRFGPQFRGQGGGIAPAGRTQRLLVGPFANARAANNWVSELKRAGGDAFVWNSGQGEEVTVIGGR